MAFSPLTKVPTGLTPTVGSGTSPHPTPPDAPESSSADRAIRKLSQPKRILFHFLSSKYASGELKAGGRVVIHTGPRQRQPVPSTTGLMKGRV